MLCYDSSLATPGNTTTSGSANTEVNTVSIKAGTRTMFLLRFLAGGMAAALSQLSGIAHKAVYWGTASTGGTALTPKPVDPGYQACKSTVISGATNGTTRTNGPIVEAGVSGQAVWAPVIDDEKLVLEGSAANSVDWLNISPTASMSFTWQMTHGE